MKSVVSFVAGCVMSLAVSVSAWPQATADGSDSQFRQYLRQFEEGARHFVNGDATLWKQNASHKDDVTIMGGWGAYEKGWAEAEARYDWAAARFKDSGAIPKFEYLASRVSGDLAYTVTIERSEATVVGQEKPAAMSLRVTQLFRKEDGAWKLIHRHADPLIAKTAPGTVLQKRSYDPSRMATVGSTREARRAGSHAEEVR